MKSHQIMIHSTKRDWVCDCCGFHHGQKTGLMQDMNSHLPPLFACSICEKKFVRSGDSKQHLKRHAGILNNICKFCNKGYSTADSLIIHITLQHFKKFHCEIPKCSLKTGRKGHYKTHLKIVHWNENNQVLANVIEKVEKLKPDLQKLKYVWFYNSAITANSLNIINIYLN